MAMPEKDELLLMQLILMFQTTSLQHMGKLKNPLTDKIDQDLSQAQISIDMLEMIHTKTRGNLSHEEERMLSTILQELKLNYVDEVTKKQDADSHHAEHPPTTESGAQP